MNTAEVWKLVEKEIWLVTSHSDGRRGGLIATFVSQASIVPSVPRVLVGLAKYHHTRGLVEASRVFTLHLLTEDQIERVWQFGTRRGKDVDKFKGVDCAVSATGCPLFADALAWLDCRVETSMDTGDRTVYLADVVEGKVAREGSRLTVKRLLELAPPKKLRTMKEDMEHDAALDEAAIAAWRAKGFGGPA